MRRKLSKLLITGGAGFIGSEFTRQAVNKGYDVHVLDNISYAGDLTRLKEIKGKHTFHHVDICQRTKVEAVFKKVAPDAVVHFAAETHVDRSILYAEQAVKTNMLGTQIMVEAARKFKTSTFIHISTDEVYGDIEKGQFFEHTSFNPSSPYSAGKAAADMLVGAYMRTYDFPAIIVRPSNNYGPWQYPEKLMPVIIYKALNDQKIPIYGQGINVREWLYVSDCANGVMTILEKGRLGEAYNLGSGNERQNIEVVKSVLKVLKKPESLIEFVQDRPGHDLRYSLNWDKLSKELNWSPKVSFEQGVKKTVTSYIENREWLELKVAELQQFWKKVYKK